MSGAQEKISINIETSAHKLRLIDHAAEITGCSLSEFIIEAACNHAENTIIGSSHFSIDPRRFADFENLINNPPPASLSLKRTMSAQENSGALLVGYRSLKACTIGLDEVMPSSLNYGSNPIYGVVAESLAIDADDSQRDTSIFLLRDAIVRAINNSNAKVVAILIHALSDKSRDLYLSCGLLESPLQTMTFCLPLATARSVHLDAGK